MARQGTPQMPPPPPARRKTPARSQGTPRRVASLQAAGTRDARSGCSRCGSTNLRGLCWRGCGATTDMLPVFEALRLERLHTAQLDNALQAKQSRLAELQTALETRAAHREVIETLQEDVDLVNETAVTLGRELSVVLGRDVTAGGDRVLATRDWEGKVLRLMFTRFDLNRDGALSAAEWNAMQAALGGEACDLSADELRMFCENHALLHLEGSGVTLAGLTAWYAKVGAGQLREDARRLGLLVVETAVDLMRTAIDALRQVRDAEELTRSASARVQCEAEDERALSGQLRETLDVLQQRLAEQQQRTRELELENDALRASVTEAREDADAREQAALSRVGGLERDVERGRAGLLELNELLMAKVEEKELLLRDLWLLQQDHQQLLEFVSQSSKAVWQANEGKLRARREAMRLHNALRTTSGGASGGASGGGGGAGGAPSF